MAKLNINHPHSVPVEDAKVVVTQIFDKYREKYGINSRWEGDRLVLSGSGFKGEAKVCDDRVLVEAKLGMPASLIRRQIESIINKELQARLKA